MSSLNPLLVKILLIALLTLVLLVPLSRVESLIAERASLRDTAVERVAHGVGHAQSIGAVMMIIPVTRIWMLDGKECSVTHYHRLLASSVDIVGSVGTELRKSGIYTAPTFRANLHITGSISDDMLMTVLAPEPGVKKQIGSLTLFLAVSDPSGIRALDGIRVDDTLVPVSAATADGLQGVSAELIAVDLHTPRRWAFTADLVISGTERLQFLPFAQATHVNLNSPWPDPSFSGAFSPNGAPQVGPRGFTADWRVLQINRDYAQLW